MKVSEITVEKFRTYAKADDEDPDILKDFLDGAISYVKDYAHLTDEEMDASHAIAICVLAVGTDMYDNRQVQVGANNSHLNELVDSTLFIYSRNLL